jgi:hypothetical protein
MRHKKPTRKERRSTCCICNHPQHLEIDKALLGPETRREIAERFGVAQHNLTNHEHNGHLAKRIARVAQVKEVAEVLSLVQHLDRLLGDALDILESSKSVGEHELALRAIREARATLEVKGEVEGEIQRNTINQINVLQSPDWIEIRTHIMRALELEPQARVLVAEAMREYGERSQLRA